MVMSRMELIEEYKDMTDEEKEANTTSLEKFMKGLENDEI
jgi:hypothetical protein